MAGLNPCLLVFLCIFLISTETVEFTLQTEAANCLRQTRLFLANSLVKIYGHSVKSLIRTLIKSACLVEQNHFATGQSQRTHLPWKWKTNRTGSQSCGYLPQKLPCPVLAATLLCYQEVIVHDSNSFRECDLFIVEEFFYQLNKRSQKSSCLSAPDSMSNSNSTSSNESESERKKGSSTSAVNIPEWLKGSNPLDRDYQQSETRRPATGNSGLERPDWFVELTQGRRHSEIGTKVDCPFDENLISKLTVINLPNNREASSPDADILMILKSDNQPKKFDSRPQNPASDVIARPEALKSRNSNGKYNQLVKNVPSARHLDRPLNEDNFFVKNCANFWPKKSSSLEKDIHLLEVESLSEELETDFDFDDFIIPELPRGKEIVFELHSNWGDPEFIGLGGIEVFDSNSKARARVKQIICDPTPWASDQNIVDGYYRAADESCGWLTNSQPSTPAKIKIIFEQEVRIALIRIWNYRASSDETWRGVRFLVVKLDNETIFKGEIERASDESNDKFGDTILFTMDEEILERVAENDENFKEN